MTTTPAPKPQTLLAVRDVLASSFWYADLLQLEPLSRTPEDTHGNSYNRLFYNGELILQLHTWDDEGHPNLVDADKAPVGHGVLLWFQVDDFDAAVARAKALKANVVQEPAINSNSNENEMWLHDIDGYTVVISCPAERSS